MSDKSTIAAMLRQGFGAEDIAVTKRLNVESVRLTIRAMRASCELAKIYGEGHRE